MNVCVQLSASVAKTVVFVIAKTWPGQLAPTDFTDLIVHMLVRRDVCSRGRELLLNVNKLIAFGFYDQRHLK